MTFSSLISGTIPHHGKYSSRNGLIPTRIIDHHWAGTVGGDVRLANPNEAASANYIIYSDGRIVGQVPEEFRPWTSGSQAADGPSITFEIQNSTGSNGLRDDDPGSWKISDKAMASVINLTADIARRYKWGGVAPSQVRGHFEFYATACPGGYVRSRLGDIRSKSDALVRTGGTITPPTKPTPPPTAGKSISQLADEVLAGKHGDGDTRRKNLGSNYAAVQAEVNRRIVGSPGGKTIAQLADEVLQNKHGNGADRARSLGAQYNAVQQEVNRRLGQLTPPPKPAAVDLHRLAQRVIRGDYGNGDRRRQLLGANYDAVMRIVNTTKW